MLRLADCCIVDTGVLSRCGVLSTIFEAGGEEDLTDSGHLSRPDSVTLSDSVTLTSNSGSQPRRAPGNERGRQLPFSGSCTVVKVSRLHQGLFATAAPAQAVSVDPVNERNHASVSVYLTHKLLDI